MPDRLRDHAHAVAARSHVPYVGPGVGVAVLLADGRWVDAARIEVASFPAIFPVAMETMSLEDRPDVFLK